MKNPTAALWSTSDALSAFDPMAKSATDKLEADNLEQTVIPCADPLELHVKKCRTAILWNKSVE